MCQSKGVRRALSFILAGASVFASSQDAKTSQTWYGPATAEFQVQFPGNPYDPDSNDVRVLFTGDHNEKFERIAYFDNGSWKAVLVTPAEGRYRATLVRNGVASMESPVGGEILDLHQRLPHGFIRRDPIHANRFRFDSGDSYYPFGFDVAWQDAKLPPYNQTLEKMGRAGLNWTRIWANHWDGKNPWWSDANSETLPGQLSGKAIANLSAWFSACETSGLNFQFVLFHHGQFSTKTDPNWPDNPLNADKGGPLKSPADFFTDATAKKETKKWLRYAVARWSSSPNLMAWELFNEVQLTDAASNGHWKEIADWHAEMATYIRSIDPYKHLITTSSEMGRPELWEAMDFYDAHRYQPVKSEIVDRQNALQPKPLVIGEFGPVKPDQSTERSFVRDSLWRNVLTNEASPGMYWYWDRVEQQNLYPEFSSWAKVFGLSHIGDHPAGREIRVRTEGSELSGLGEVDWLLLRVPPSQKLVFASTGLADGSYKAHLVHLSDGKVDETTASLKGFKCSIDLPVTDDSVLILNRSDQ